MLDFNEELVEEKYREMKKKGITIDILHEALGLIKLYINEKPTRELFSTKIGEDTVYVGTN